MTTTRVDKNQNEFILSKENSFFQFHEQEQISFGAHTYTLASVNQFEFGQQKRQFWMITKGNVLSLYRLVDNDDELFSRAEKLAKVSFNKERSNLLKILTRFSQVTFEQTLEIKKLLFVYQLDYIFSSFFTNSNHAANLEGALNDLLKLDDVQMLSLTIQLSIVLQTVHAFSLQLDI